MNMKHSITNSDGIAQETDPPWQTLYQNSISSKRSGPLFNAFSYPTKISPEAIALFIAAHTSPGDTVLDPFGGSGTTGIAAKLCERPTKHMQDQVKAMGLQVNWGPRHAVLYELSVVGSQLSNVMCNPPSPSSFEKAVHHLIDEVESENGWMYLATDPNGEKGLIRHTIWSEVLICPTCNEEVTFWDACVRVDPAKIQDTFTCETCSTSVSQKACARANEIVVDGWLAGESRKTRRRVPVRVHGTTGSVKWQRAPTDADIELINTLQSHKSTAWAPTSNIDWGDLHRDGYHRGIDRFHHLYTDRNLKVMAAIWEKIARFPEELQQALRLLVLSYNSTHATLMTRVVAKKNQKDLVLTGAQSGVLYISSLPVEKNLFEGIRRKIKTFTAAFELTFGSDSNVSVFNESSTKLGLEAGTIDYVFTDPPFGAYIPYAEINQINEAWLGRMTERHLEAIVSPAQDKQIADYKTLLDQVFTEAGRVLAPDGLATVIFHSSKAEVWNAVHEALTGAELAVEKTAVLDKTQLSFKQATSVTSSRDDAILLLKKKQRHTFGSAENTPSDLQILRQVVARALQQADSAERTAERIFSRYVGKCLEQERSPALDTRAVYKKLNGLEILTPTDSHINGAIPPHQIKRLGQYFSGSAVSRLLAALAIPNTVANAIDPMAGRGDLLLGLLSVAAPLNRIAAIEIEDQAFEICKTNVGLAHVDGECSFHNGNAFDPAAVDADYLEGWDLVITNPPYVRYQTGSAREIGLGLPSAAEVREGLIEILEQRSATSEFIQEILTMAHTYSGLADLAVPAWLLCAALVKPGGTLAIVVPDTWLSREYATPIKEVLIAHFDIEIIIEDADATWFRSALVRTNLVIARRRTPKSGASTTHVAISGKAASATSIVGALYSSTEPEQQFSAAICGETTWADQLPKSAIQHRLITRDTFFQKRAGVAFAKKGLLDIVPDLMDHTCKMKDYGWQVGQGMRTGANFFFYVDILSRENREILLRTSRQLGEVCFSLPERLVKVALRNQRELPEHGRIVDGELIGGLLHLDGLARPVDVANKLAGDYADNLDMPQALLDYIDFAESLNIGTDSNPKYLPNLSAVRTNVSSANAARCWYHLPPLTQRHVPDLFVPRLNHKTPKFFFNEGRAAIIDANFSTLWREATDALQPLSMLALLSSSFTTALLESSSTIMAGGALKLEAGVLKEVILPKGIRKCESELQRLGESLLVADNGDTIDRIDEIVGRLMRLTRDQQSRLRSLGADLVAARRR